MTGTRLQRLLATVAMTAISVALGFQVAGGRGERLLQVAAVVALVAAALRWPAVMIALVVCLEGLAKVFSMTNLPSLPLLAGEGVRIVDIVLLAMLGALLVRLARGGLKETSRILVPEFALFGALLIAEIARNYSRYGLSALGEFRIRYLALVIIPYMVLFLRDAGRRKRMVALFITLYLAVPLALSPLAAMLVPGRGGRFFPASIVLGLVLGAVLLSESSRAGLIRLPRWMVGLLLVAVLTAVLVNAHRSVWIASFAAIAALVLLGRIRYARALPAILLLVLLGGSVFLTGWQSVFETYEFVADKSQGLVRPLEDGTGAWRFYVWKANIESVREDPVFGEGFGGYWHVYVPELGGDVAVAPHNLYVQTVVKLGFVGLLLFVLLVTRFFVEMRRALDGRADDDPDVPILVSGIVGLVAALAYFIAYPLDVYGLCMIGLGLSAAVRPAVAAVGVAEPTAEPLPGGAAA